MIWTFEELFKFLKASVLTSLQVWRCKCPLLANQRGESTKLAVNIWSTNIVVRSDCKQLDMAGATIPIVAP